MRLLFVALSLFTCLTPACGGSTPPPRPAEKEAPPSASTTDSAVLEQIAAFTKQISDQLSRADKKLRVAVMPFTDIDGRGNALGKYVAEKVVVGLGHSDRYDLIERTRLDQVMTELKLSSSAMISDASAASLGNMLGADALLIGTFTDLGATIDLNCRVVAPETGVILAAASTTLSRSPMIDHLFSSAPQTAAAAPGQQSKPAQPAPIAVPPLVAGAAPAPVELATNRPGQDYKTFTLEVRTADACQRICAADNVCKAFTFAPQGDHGRCWLKNGIPGPVADARFISGVKTEAMLGLVRPASAARERKAFNVPKLDGHPIDVCATWARDCNQGSANAWCQRQGYARAWHFVAAPDIGDKTPTILQNDPKRGLCDKRYCDGFATVICER